MQTIGTADEVLRAFVAGEALRTRAARVPGGRRVSVDREPDGSLSLYSYRTIVARRLPDGRIAVTPRRYSVTTSKLLGKLTRLVRGDWSSASTAIAEAYNDPELTLIEVTVAVPGRWGGYGLPWHPTGRETLPFVVVGRA